MSQRFPAFRSKLRGGRWAAVLMLLAIVLASIDDVRALKGQGPFHSPWLRIDQETINRFADIIHDRQWIHVDVERARTGIRDPVAPH